MVHEARVIPDLHESVTLFMTTYHLHLVSDATGETIHSVARACLVQFEGVKTIEHVWAMVRSEARLDKVLEAIEQEPGIVMFTLVDDKLRVALRDACHRLRIPCIPVLDSVIAQLAKFFGRESQNLPGRQHAMDAEYFDRIAAMDYVLRHDDGQSAETLEDADVILVGVSRTSKTPTCVYLANRGIKAANVPIVPGCPLPETLFKAKRPLVIGLIKDSAQLVQIRRQRMRMLKQEAETEYTDPAIVREEVQQSRQMFQKNGWHILDVSRRSIEETAAAILELHARRKAEGE